MIQHNGTRFVRTRVPVDNQQFENCVFDNVAIVYAATGPCNFRGCTFHDCTFHFEGPALATIKFMSGLYKLDPQLIEKTFDSIRLDI